MEPPQTAVLSEPAAIDVPTEVDVPANCDYLETLFKNGCSDIVKRELRWIYAETAKAHSTLPSTFLAQLRAHCLSPSVSAVRAHFIIIAFSLVLPCLRLRLASGCDRRFLQPILYFWRDHFKICAARMHTYWVPAGTGRPPLYHDWQEFTNKAISAYIMRFDMEGQYTAEFDHHQHTGFKTGYKSRDNAWVRNMQTAAPDAPMTVSNFRQSAQKRREEGITNFGTAVTVDTQMDAAVTGMMSIVAAISMLRLHDARHKAALTKLSARTDPTFTDSEFPSVNAIQAMLYVRLVPLTEARCAAYDRVIVRKRPVDPHVAPARPNPTKYMRLDLTQDHTRDDASSDSDS